MPKIPVHFLLFPLLIFGGQSVSSGIVYAWQPQSSLDQTPQIEEAAEAVCDHTRLMDLEVVDLHSHFFNLDYVPLKGIFYRFGVPWPAAGVLAKILHGATPTIDPGLDCHPVAAPPCEDLAALSSEQVLGRIEDRLLDFDSRALERLRRQRSRLRKPLERHRLREAMEKDPTLADKPSRRRAVQQRIRQEYSDKEALDLVVELLYQAFLRPETGPESLYTEEAVEKASFRGAVEALYVLMSDEREIIEHAKCDFPEVELFVHHMMDLERVYRNKPPLLFEEQIGHAACIGRRYPAQLEFFGAFDPFRRNDDLAWQAVQAGALGAKFYPPSGYRPTDTECPPRPKLGFPITASCAKRKQHRARYKGFCPSGINNLNLEFFAKAAEEGAAIFSHQNKSGFEAGDDYGELFGEPCHWQSVFQQLEEQKVDPARLTVILAHAGGTGAWFGDDPEKWASSYALQAYNLCVSYENVYCDFGYSSRILEARGRENFARRLQRLLNRPVDPDRPLPGDLCQLTSEVEPRYSIGKKIVYGSDWLVSVDGRRADYACRFDEALEKVSEGDDPLHLRADFFAANAKRALGVE